MTLPPSATSPATLRAYRVRCPVCGAEPQRVCREAGRDMRDVHAARAEESRR